MEHTASSRQLGIINYEYYKCNLHTSSLQTRTSEGGIKGFGRQPGTVLWLVDGCLLFAIHLLRLPELFAKVKRRCIKCLTELVNRRQLGLNIEQ